MGHEQRTAKEQVYDAGKCCCRRVGVSCDSKCMPVKRNSETVGKGHILI